MAFYLKTHIDPEGKQVRIERAIRGANDTCFLVLRRLPPHYAKPPLFVVKLTSERLDIRGEGGERSHYRKAYAHQEFTPKEIDYLLGLKPGNEHLPFFNFSYPNVIARMGKKVRCMTDAETQAVANSVVWKLVQAQ